MIQQAAIFQTSHFYSCFLCSFIYTRSPWSLIDHSESPTGILKAKVHAIHGKDKTNSFKNCWRISTVLIEKWMKRHIFFNVSLWQSCTEGMGKLRWVTLCYNIYHKSMLLMQADKTSHNLMCESSENRNRQIFYKPAQQKINIKASLFFETALSLVKKNSPTIHTYFRNSWF